MPEQQQQPLKQQRLEPDCYPSRASIGDPTNWRDENYQPHEYEAPVLLKKDKPAWADVVNLPSSEVANRLSWGAQGKKTTVGDACELDAARDKFLNPKGKTGIRGRGLLGRWGPNHAADCIVTRFHHGSFEVLLVTKHVADGSAKAFPAGMVDPGATVPQTLRDELTQEAVEDSGAVDRLFGECDMGVVYRGHVDDFRNTDHAWMETVVQHFHATPEIAADLRLGTADVDEIKGSAWYQIDEVTEMYASHYDWLCTVRARLLSMADDKPRQEVRQARAPHERDEDGSDPTARASKASKL